MLSALLIVGLAIAAPVRHAIVVGANDGSSALEDLRYAEDDARRMAEVLVELGGFRADRVTVLYGPDTTELSAAFQAHADIARATDEDLFLFYYSGHADPQGLRLASEVVTYPALRRLVRDVPSDVRIGVLDACRSGEITRVKGMDLSAPFAAEASRGKNAEGEAWITATAPGEAAQESDLLRGSFFTHYLTSGLRGAADADDGQVSLGEAYAYAYDRTVSRTATTTGGTQHPAYDFRLQGRGDLTLTDVRTASARLVLPEALEGELTVLSLPDLLPVVEVYKRPGKVVRLGVPAGSYLLRVRDDHGVREVRAGLSDGAELVVRGLVAQELLVATAKGEAAPVEEAGSAPSDEPDAVPSAEPPPSGELDRMMGGLNRKINAAVRSLDPRTAQGSSRRANREDPPVTLLSAPTDTVCPESDLRCLDPLPEERSLADGPVLLTWPDGGRAAEGALRGGARTGRWVFWYPDGRRLAEGAYWEGARTGTWNWWSASGVRQQRGSYDAGRRDDLWTEWGPDGRRILQVAYKNDVADGRYSAWYPDGNPRREGRMKAGQATGAWTFWHDNGARAARGHFHEGQREGDWQTWYANGETEHKGAYHLDLPVGRHRAWWPGGARQSTGTYMAGKKDGRWRTWDDQGHLQSRGRYAEDVATGRWRVREADGWHREQR